MYFDSDVERTPQLQAEYENLLTTGRIENFSELDNAEPLRIIGVDNEGRRLVIFVPSLLGALNLKPERALTYCVLKLENIVLESFAIILCLSHTQWAQESGLSFMHKYYELLPKQSKKNLKRVYMVHSGLATSGIMACSRPFMSNKFWNKIESVETLEGFLRKIRLPPFEALRQFPYLIQREEEIMLQREVVSVFGCDFDTLSLRFGKDIPQFKLIPSMLIDIVREILKPGVISLRDLLYLQCDPPTLYRIVGEFETGDPTISYDNPAAVITLFRLFLDSQPYPLLGVKALEQLGLSFDKADPPRDKLILQMRKILEGVTPRHTECLKYLINFFQKVEKRSSQNLMTFDRMAHLLAPTFFRPEMLTQKSIRQIPLSVQATKVLLTQSKLLFQFDDEEEEEDEDEDEDEEEEEENANEKIDQNKKATASATSKTGTTRPSSEKRPSYPVEPAGPGEEEEEEDDDEEEEDEEDEEEESE